MVRRVLVALFALPILACGSAKPTDTGAGAASGMTPESVCRAESPCANAQQQPEELAACIEMVKGKMGDPCLGAMVAMKECTLGHIVCTPDGDAFARWRIAAKSW